MLEEAWGGQVGGTEAEERLARLEAEAARARCEAEERTAELEALKTQASKTGTLLVSGGTRVAFGGSA